MTSTVTKLNTDVMGPGPPPCQTCPRRRLLLGFCPHPLPVQPGPDVFTAGTDRGLQNSHVVLWNLSASRFVLSGLAGFSVSSKPRLAGLFREGRLGLTGRVCRGAWGGGRMAVFGGWMTLKPKSLSQALECCIPLPPGMMQRGAPGLPPKLPPHP